MTNEVHTPASRFNDLPEETQKFLSRLDEEDIKLLEEGLVLVRSTQTIGRFLKWTIVGALGLLVAINSLHENGMKAWGWLFPSK